MTEDPTTSRPVNDGPTPRRMAWARSVLLGTGHDQATRHQATVALVEQVDRLEAMLEHTKDMITVLDENGQVLFSNRAAGLLTGHGEEVNGTNALDFIHPEDVDAASAAFTRCVQVPGLSINEQIRIRHADGTWHHVDAYAENCLDDPVVGVVVSMRDVCERRDVEASLQRANESMRAFVAVASHDLRSPVAVVRGLAGTLVSEWSTMAEDERLEVAEVVARAADRMGRLVENLLMVSRLDAGVSAGTPSPINLAEAVEAAVAEMEENEEVRLAVPEDMVVLVDPAHLSRVLTNYLHNAAHHGRPPITVLGTRAGTMVELRVLDRGGGVPEEFVPRLFERFSRAAADQTRGTGLGLSIVRDLARAAGGDAWYEPGHAGACFVVSLPSP